MRSTACCILLCSQFLIPDYISYTWLVATRLHAPFLLLHRVNSLVLHFRRLHSRISEGWDESCGHWICCVSREYAWCSGALRVFRCPIFCECWKFNFQPRQHARDLKFNIQGGDYGRKGEGRKVWILTKSRLQPDKVIKAFTSRRMRWRQANYCNIWETQRQMGTRIHRCSRQSCPFLCFVYLEVSVLVV